jgi:hypothetical protein
LEDCNIVATSYIWKLLFQPFDYGGYRDDEQPKKRLKVRKTRQKEAITGL